MSPLTLLFAACAAAITQEVPITEPTVASHPKMTKEDLMALFAMADNLQKLRVFVDSVQAQKDGDKLEA